MSHDIHQGAAMSFVEERTLDNAADDQGYGHCPLCRDRFGDADIKKLRVDAPAVSSARSSQSRGSRASSSRGDSPEDVATGLLKVILEAWNDDKDELAALITDVLTWLDGQDENEFLSLRNACEAFEERKDLESDISENKDTIRSYKKKLKSCEKKLGSLEDSRFEDDAVCLAKEESIQELQEYVRTTIFILLMI
ncbi:hypothetical protein V5O48_017608 [Marasmius crinis-equi]|uniref:Uncharacterized protein n=1 Tax=Marasmius crinis-equi TaxID=585013 RepID=A0ABR3ENI6_9AGAR